MMGLANKIPVPSEGASNRDHPHSEAFGIYVHVPFCAHACDFCAFYQVEPRRGDIERYLEALALEARLIESPPPVDTAFWGGGTPGVLSAADLERLGRIQLDRFGAPRHEWTVELAPGSVKRDKLQALRALGVTRVSLGVQSFSERMLQVLGRRHSLRQIHRAWDLVRSVGFHSVSLDLIFAVPGQTLEAWRSDLEAAVALGPDHLSTYCLTFEEDTAMFLRLSEGKVSLDPEREREFYLATWEFLGEAGLAQYEISNFARPGHRCAHNVNTWRMQSWVGLGPSAAGQFRGLRSSNPHDLDAWARGVQAGVRATEEPTQLTPAQLLEDSVIFGLRMNDGLEVGELEGRFGRAAIAVLRPGLDRLADQSLGEWLTPSRFALTRDGRLVADSIGSELIGFWVAASA